MPEVTALLPADPDTVGPYRIEGRLGTGGQGTVYLGGTDSGRRVAVKLLHPHLVADERARARFLSEVEIAKRVAPFCTAKVLDSGFVNGQPYIVSEFVDGPSLQESVLGTGPRGGAALERLALNTVTALAAIHEAGVVHRDFKPGNVLLGPDGPVVIDFGIARALDPDRSIVTSQVVGSPGYMAPEQITVGEIGPAADLFAWGATMVFAATARRPFGGDSIPAVMHAILHDEPDLDGLDGRFGDIVRACLAKDPARRPTAAEVGDGLRALPDPAWRPGNAPVTEPDGGAGQDAEAGRAPAGAAGRRRPLRAGIAALALLAVLGIAYPVVTPEQGEGSPGALRPPGTVTLPGGTAGASPGPAATPAGRSGPPSATPRTSPSSGGGQAPKNPAGTPRPDGTKSPRPKKPSSPPAGEDPPPGPKVLGTVSGSDVNGYCKSQGYVAAGGGEGNWWCYGPGGMPVNMTNVCRWAYPGYPNARAYGTTCKSS